MNAAAKGRRRNEHRSMAVLESAGYRCTRSAASLGAWTSPASSRDVVLCQVKTRLAGQRSMGATDHSLSHRPSCRKFGS